MKTRNEGSASAVFLTDWFAHTGCPADGLVLRNRNLAAYENETRNFQTSHQFVQRVHHNGCPWPSHIYHIYLDWRRRWNKLQQPLKLEPQLEHQCHPQLQCCRHSPMGWHNHQQSVYNLQLRPRRWWWSAGNKFCPHGESNQFGGPLLYGISVCRKQSD